MARVHMTLQGKGGVGKSFVASLLAQHFTERDLVPLCFDTDPVNQTFAGYKRFNVEVIRLGDRPDEINPRNFDRLIEKILQAPDDATVVIDSGAATFMPLLGYMVEAAPLDYLRENGHHVTLHTILTGGQGLNDTVAGLHTLSTMLPDLPLVVWLNEYFGKVGLPSGENSGSFEDSGLYQRLQDRIHATIRLPELRRETFGRDLAEMMQARLTFPEVGTSPDFTIMSRQRLCMAWRAMNTAMNEARL